MPIDYKKQILDAEEKQNRFLNAPVDLSGTEGRLAEDRGLFAKNFNVDPRTAQLKEPQLNRSRDENLDKIKYGQKMTQLDRKWEAVFNAAYMATNDVRVAIDYTNKWMDQNTDFGNIVKANKDAMESKDRMAATNNEFSERGVSLQQKYAPQTDPYLAIASLLSSGTQGYLAYNQWNKGRDNTTKTNTPIKTYGSNSDMGTGLYKNVNSGDMGTGLYTNRG